MDAIDIHDRPSRRAWIFLKSARKNYDLFKKRSAFILRVAIAFLRRSIPRMMIYNAPRSVPDTIRDHRRAAEASLPTSSSLLLDPFALETPQIPGDWWHTKYQLSN
jgi:hypothetical protein